MSDPGTDGTAGPELPVRDNYSAEVRPGQRVGDRRAKQFFTAAAQSGNPRAGFPGTRQPRSPERRPAALRPHRAGSTVGAAPHLGPGPGHLPAHTGLSRMPTPEPGPQDVNPSRGPVGAQRARRHSDTEGREPRRPSGGVCGALGLYTQTCAPRCPRDMARASSAERPTRAAHSWLGVTPGVPGGRAPAERSPPPDRYLRQTPRWS